MWKYVSNRLAYHLLNLRAVYRTLAHKSSTLTIIEKMLLLRDIHKMKSDTAIKGTQLIPENYKWIIETLKSK